MSRFPGCKCKYNIEFFVSPTCFKMFSHGTKPEEVSVCGSVSPVALSTFVNSVCVCVRKRERERERERGGGKREAVSVCVCERERVCV